MQTTDLLKLLIGAVVVLILIEGWDLYIEVTTGGQL